MWALRYFILAVKKNLLAADNITTNLEHFYVNWNEKKNMETEKIFQALPA